MWIDRRIILAIITAVGLGVLPAAADTCGSALNSIGVITGVTTYSDSGCFQVDNDLQVFTFTLDTQDLVNLYTSSWATGGFSAILTLFDSTGTQIAVDHGGVYSSNPSLNTCGPRGVGTADGENTCLDAYISSLLGPGSYTLVLSEAGNCASCGNFATGNYTGFPDPNYAQNHHQYFTGFEWYGNTSTDTFLSPNNGNPLSGGFTVHIDDFVPEPGTWILSMAGLLFTWVTLRRRGSSQS